jgi:La-related protein 7
MKRSSVKKALEAFQEFNSVLRYEDTEPATLKSVMAYVKEQSEGTNEGQAASSGDEEDVESTESTQDEKDRSKDEDIEAPAAKKQKLDTTDEEAKQLDLSKPQSDVAESETEKKKRKRRKKPVTAKESIQDTRWKDMKIMAKRDWKRLRNKYLDAQRKKFKEIKKQLMLGRRKEEPVKRKAVPVKKVKTSPQNMNFYGALPQQEAAAQPESACVATKQVNKAMLQKPLFSFEPGLIVNVKFRESCVDVKDFKDELRQYPYVKYVDVKEGDMETFVRVDKPASANLLVKQYSSADYQSALILSGESETNYWDKILKDRENKLNKTVKVKQARGRDKIIKKAAVHVHFDDDEG